MNPARDAMRTQKESSRNSFYEGIRRQAEAENRRGAYLGTYAGYDAQRQLHYIRIPGGGVVPARDVGGGAVQRGRPVMVVTNGNQGRAIVRSRG